MLGVVEVTMKWFAHNAVFEPPAMDHETCPSYWWRNLLYINTLFPVEQMVRDPTMTEHYTFWAWSVFVDNAVFEPPA